MLSSWTIGRKLTVAFGVVGGLLLVASAGTLYTNYSAKQSLDRSTRITASARGAAEIEAFTRGMDGYQKLILVAGLTGVVERSEAGHKGIAEARREIATRLDTLRQNSLGGEATTAVAAIATDIELWEKHHAAILALVEKQDFDNALTIDLGDSFVAQQKVLEAAEHLQAVLTAEAERDTQATQRAGFIWMAVAIVVMGAAVVVGFVVTVVIRQITGALGAAAAELRTSSQQVASASNQVASSSQSLSQGATEQAASLEETSAAMEEMASMTRQNAENSQQAAAQVAETERLVRGANSALQELVGSMSAIRESSSKVTKIIKTIDEIAFQTNILALNAAVEAARAGEAGMGFAVVADEVRNLAQRSAQAARDTAGLIEESAGNAASGGSKVDAVVSAIAAITTSSTRVHSLVDEVSAASRQQADGIDQVTQALAQMEKVTQTTAATAEESAAASQELHAQAGQAMAVVARLETMVDGGQAGPGAARVSTPPARRPAVAATVLKMVRGNKPATPRTDAAESMKDTGTFGAF
jgi:methyl-accepting chemotaxis protein/methyl-accepting chemotaxis protein-1 (serine sensor receptor)